MVRYTTTNESLGSILEGLDVQPGDNILSIAGSGDQVFAMVSKGAHVIAVDLDPDQIKYMEERIGAIKKGNYKEFLGDLRGNTSEATGRGGTFRSSFEERNRFLQNRKVLSAIRRGIEKITVIEMNICEGIETFMTGGECKKGYLSNSLGGIYPNDEKSLRESIKRMQEGKLIYDADKHPIMDEFLAKELLKIDDDLTERAKGKNTCTRWCPYVYRV